MKKNILKKNLSLFLSLTLCSGLTACQKTPDEALVAQKNPERLESAVKETVGEETSLKTIKESSLQTYTYSYGKENDSLYITADAPVILPESDSLSAYRISSGYLSQEMVTGIYNYLFKGQKTYTTTGTDFTKEACRQRILEKKQFIAEVNAEAELPEDQKESILQELQTSIEELEEEYDSLPETSTLKTVEADSTLLKRADTDTTGHGEYYVDCDTEDNSWFLVSSDSPDADNGSSIIYLCGSSDTNYSSHNNALPVTEEQARSDIADSIGISFDEAKKMADGLFQSAGVDARLVQIWLESGYTEEGDNHNPYLNKTELINEEDYSAYRFLYTRVIDNTEAACTSMSYIIASDDNRYAKTWNYETIDIIISKNGMEFLRWESPITLDEKISDNVKLMSFRDAASVFEKMVPAIYQGRMESVITESHQPTYKVDVTSVKLCLMRVRSNASERSGLLVPAWVFYGEWYETKYTEENGKPHMMEELPFIILAVNAVDGTVIDPMEGY